MNTFTFLAESTFSIPIGAAIAGTLHTYGHTQIDGSPDWWALVRKELNGWVNPPKAILP